MARYIKFAFYSGIRRATQRVLKFKRYWQALQFYACKHAIISSKRRLVMRYFAFLEITKGFSRKNSSIRPQESCFEVEIGFSYWCRRSTLSDILVNFKTLWVRISLCLVIKKILAISESPPNTTIECKFDISSHKYLYGIRFWWIVCSIVK